MKICWSDSPGSRPPFPEVLKQLNEIHIIQFGCTMEEQQQKRNLKGPTEAGCCTIS